MNENLHHREDQRINGDSSSPRTRNSSHFKLLPPSVPIGSDSGMTDEEDDLDLQLPDPPDEETHQLQNENINPEAMTLERYVAICMPLRHGELCSTRSAMHCILIIHGLSAVPLKVAKAASGENKKSTWKGLRTVILHAFQLLLCLIQLWGPGLAEREDDDTAEQRLVSFWDVLVFKVIWNSPLSEGSQISRTYSFFGTAWRVFREISMTLERYVAICMPLRHGELCSTRSAMHCILIIHGLSAVPCIMVLSAFFATASLSFYTKKGRLPDV
ncbi:hypothetical protein NQZ68_012895 [Dissostichus eleginoides]|nr:hypothetical protein NQZ68_012895 [Dissostichus eleginoides]